VGIRYGRDLLRFSLRELCDTFGKSGGYYYWIVRGVDNRPVEPSRERKSIGREHTFNQDISRPAEMLHHIRGIAEAVASHLQEAAVFGKTVTLKVRYHDFCSVSRSSTLNTPVQDPETIYTTAVTLFNRTDAASGQAVRLLGISLSGLHLDGEAGSQLELPFQ